MIDGIWVGMWAKQAGQVRGHSIRVGVTQFHSHQLLTDWTAITVFDTVSVGNVSCIFALEDFDRRRLLIGHPVDVDDVISHQQLDAVELEIAAV